MATAVKRKVALKGKKVSLPIIKVVRSVPVTRVEPGESSPKKSKKTVAPNWFRMGYLVHDVARMRRTLYDQALKPLGITRSQWWVLANISRHPKHGVVSSVLARDLDVGKVTLSGLIERLEVAGYVYRRNHRTDRRAKLVFITEKGFELIERMKEVITPLNRQLVEGLSPEELATVEGGLSKVKANLRALLGEDDSLEDVEDVRRDEDDLVG